MQKRIPAAKPTADEGTPLRRALSEMFGIDVRSLAAFRIGVACVLLADLGMRARNLVSHYTDYGVLPRSAWNAFYGVEDSLGRKYWWSLHRLSGQPWWEVVLFGVAALLALALLVGYRTRLTIVGCWIMLASLQARNPLVNSSAEDLLICPLFWAMFLPLGAVWSMDRWLRPATGPRPQRVASAASVAMLLQIAMVYLFTAALKNDPAWTTDNTAIYYALSLDMFATPWGNRMLVHPNLLRFLTAATWWLEWLSPVVVFSPIFRGPLRMLVVLVFWGFHLGLAMTMHLGIFPWISLVVWLVFVPSGCWDLLARGIPRLVCEAAVSWMTVVARFLSRFLRGRYAANPDWRLGPVQTILVSLLLVYTVAWNLWDFFPGYLTARPSWNVVGRLTRLNQRWAMFAPAPTTDNGWYVLRGVLHDGAEVNLWSPDSPLPWDKPERVFETTYHDSHNQKLLWNLWNLKYVELRKYFADWLRWRWDRDQAGTDSKRRVRQVDMFFMLHRTPPPGQPSREPQAVLLWTSYYTEEGVSP